MFGFPINAERDFSRHGAKLQRVIGEAQRAVCLNAPSVQFFDSRQKYRCIKVEITLERLWPTKHKIVQTRWRIMRSILINGSLSCVFVYTVVHCLGKVKWLDTHGNKDGITAREENNKKSIEYRYFNDDDYRYNKRD